MKFAIALFAPAHAPSSRRALRFAQAALDGGHEIVRLFFYQDGVHNGSGLHTPASDETDLVALWRDLAVAQGIAIDICVAAAMRRGVLDETESKSAGKAQFNLQAPFRLSGLGQLAEASLTADRFVQF